MDIINTLETKYQLTPDSKGVINLPNETMYEKTFNTLSKYMEEDEARSTIHNEELTSVFRDKNNCYILIANFDEEQYQLKVEKLDED